VTIPFCRQHRSHACPCVRPGWYEDPEMALEEWDKAEAAEQRKRAQKRIAPLRPVRRVKKVVAEQEQMEL
jgi:hypothetical protein